MLNPLKAFDADGRLVLGRPMPPETARAAAIRLLDACNGVADAARTYWDREALVQSAYPVQELGREEIDPETWRA